MARFLKGVFELKPSLPRYSSIWDVRVVLEHLRTLGPPTQLELKALTKKTTMLLCLLKGYRCQTLTKLDTALMQELIPANSRALYVSLTPVDQRHRSHASRTISHA